MWRVVSAEVRMRDTSGRTESLFCFTVVRRCCKEYDTGLRP